MIDFKKPRQTIQPAIYFVSLHAVQGTQVVIYNSAVAAFTRETAHSESIAIMKEKEAELYQQGMNLGGWKMQQHIELNNVKIDTMLVRAYEGRDEIEKEKEKQDRNALMQTIVDTASRKVLNKYKEWFTTAEIGYMEEEIQKYEGK